MKAELNYFRDGAVCVSVEDGASNEYGQECDLVFALGALSGDPDLERQIKIAEYVVEAINNYPVKVLK